MDFPDGPPPTTGWFYTFLRRNPNISFRKCKNISVAMANVNPNQLLEFHPVVETYLQSIHVYYLLEDPSRTTNADETNWVLDSRPGKVLVGKKGLAYDIQHANTKENCTVMLCHIAG